jgi:hypothetical protein
MSLTNSGVFDTPQRFEQTMINTNQHNGGVVAATRPTAEGDDADEFRQRLATVARMLYLSAGNRCTDAQRQLLQDVMRGRYQLKTLVHLADIAQLSTNPAHREALSRVIRDRSTPHTNPVPSVAGAFDDETRINGECDVVQRMYERCPTPVNRERVLETLHAQEILTREAMEAVRAAQTQ